MPTVSSYAQALYNLALEQGLSASNPCVYQVRAGTDKYVVVATAEPTTLVLPMNVLWVKDAMHMMRRVSKTPSSGQAYTWEDVTDYDSIFNTVQTWAPEDAPIPVIVSQQGGQLTGPLYPRVAANAAAYTAAETVPKSIVQSLIDAFKSSVMSMYNNMNNRVLYNDQRIRNLQIGQSSITDRLTVVENNQGGLELLFIQELASDVWAIEHNFGSDYKIFVDIYDESGDILWPDSIQPMDEHVSIVHFLGLHSGYARVQGMRIP